MHKYIPNTNEEQRQMMEKIGVSEISGLFSVIPKEIRQRNGLDLPEKLTEQELVSFLGKMAGENRTTEGLVCFLGAGTYDHYIPSVVGAMASRSEFYTAYTPYQAEISQGMLQAIFEFQTMVCELTGMEAANASMYDGASATAEAFAISLVSSRNKSNIVVSSSVHPETRDVIRTYMSGRNVEIREVPLKDGETDYAALEEMCDGSTAAICIQSPNFLGIIENMDMAGEIAHRNDAAFIVNTDLMALAVLKAPGDSAADFVVGDAQPMGNPMAFGGPHLGFFTANAKYMRKMPGRIVGETTDSKGNRGYVLTLQAREQHIRREKATSNICSNHALNALAATIYMSTVGKTGLRDIALRCANNARFACDELVGTGKFKKAFDKPYFKEFAVEAFADIEKINRELLAGGYLGGYQIGRKYPGMEKLWLVAVTEKRTRDEIEDFAGKAGAVK